jgi:hypothetical protein
VVTKDKVTSTPRGGVLRGEVVLLPCYGPDAVLSSNVGQAKRVYMSGWWECRGVVSRKTKSLSFPVFFEGSIITG